MKNKTNKKEKTMEQTQIKKHYMAISSLGGWTVGSERYTNGPIQPTTGVRVFKTYQEADLCARQLADGLYGYKPGIYVCNR